MGNGSSKQWVLLAAGSNGWGNYRHQANVCHAYQIAHRNGIPDDQIVVMMYDDIAYNSDNPFPGNIINVQGGPNVYPGVLKDYTGEDVSAKNFLAVLRGDSSAVIKREGTKKVIESNKNDSIFVYLSDHGGHGIFRFPHTTLYAHDLTDTVQTMSSYGKFSKMVLYLEACHSGSMVEALQNTGNVYVVASCQPHEVTYACFMDKKRETFLSDVFTANWLYHTETVKLDMTSFKDQFFYLKKNVSEAVRKTTKGNETPCNFGNMNMLQLKLSELLGKCSASVSYTPQPLNFTSNDVVDSTAVPLIIQENRIKNEQDLSKKRAHQRQYDELVQKRKTMDLAVKKIAERTGASRALTEKREVTCTYELKVVAEHFRETLFDWHDDPFVVTHSHLQVLVNLCESEITTDRIKAAINRVKHEIQF